MKLWLRVRVGGWVFGPGDFAQGAIGSQIPATAKKGCDVGVLRAMRGGGVAWASKRMRSADAPTTRQAYARTHARARTHSNTH